MKKERLKIDNKQKADKVLKDSNFRPKWEDNILVVSYKFYDEVTDILIDNNIEFNN